MSSNTERSKKIRQKIRRDQMKHETEKGRKSALKEK